MRPRLQHKITEAMEDDINSREEFKFEEKERLHLLDNNMIKGAGLLVDPDERRNSDGS